MQSLFLKTSPLNFNIFGVALDIVRAIWEYRTKNGIPTDSSNFRIHEGDVKQIIQILEANDLIVVPKSILMQLLELHRRSGGVSSDKPEGGE